MTPTNWKDGDMNYIFPGTERILSRRLAEGFYRYPYPLLAPPASGLTVLAFSIRLGISMGSLGAAEGY